MHTLSDVLSRATNMESWEVFQDFFGFLCILLDSKMAAEAGASTNANMTNLSMLYVCVYIYIGCMQSV